MVNPMSDSEPIEIQITGEHEMRGGIWANFAMVSHSPHEFTIDFVRLDYVTKNPTQGIIVQRVNMSPLFVEQLIGALRENLEKFAKSMPDGMSPEEKP